MKSNGHPGDEKLIDYVDGTITKDDRKAIVEHLESCERCSAYVQSLQQIFRLLSHDSVPQVEESFFTYLPQRILKRSQASASRRSWRFAFAPVVAVASVVVLLLVVFRFPAQPEFDTIDLMMSEMSMVDLIDVVSDEDGYDVLLYEAGQALEPADEYLMDETPYDLIEALSPAEGEQLVIEIEKEMKSQTSGAS